MDKFAQALEEQQQITQYFRLAKRILCPHDPDNMGWERANAIFEKEGLMDDDPPSGAVDRAKEIVDQLIDEASEDAEDYRQTIASIRPGGIQ